MRPSPRSAAPAGVSRTSSASRTIARASCPSSRARSAVDRRRGELHEVDLGEQVAEPLHGKLGPRCKYGTSSVLVSDGRSAAARAARDSRAAPRPSARRSVRARPPRAAPALRRARTPLGVCADGSTGAGGGSPPATEPPPEQQRDERDRRERHQDPPPPRMAAAARMARGGFGTRSAVSAGSTLRTKTRVRNGTRSLDARGSRRSRRRARIVTRPDVPRGHETPPRRRLGRDASRSPESIDARSERSRRSEVSGAAGNSIVAPAGARTRATTMNGVADGDRVGAAR